MKTPTLVALTALASTGGTALVAVPITTAVVKKGVVEMDYIVVNKSVSQSNIF